MKRKTPDSIHQNIRKYRLLNNMTQEKLAEKLDLDTQYYAQLERGERNFTIEKIIRLCSIFNTGIENIIEVDFKEKQDTSELFQELVPRLESLTYFQLIMLEKFINEILPYIK